MSEPQSQASDPAARRRLILRLARIIGPYTAIVTGLVCAVIVWPSDLSWGCIAVAVILALSFLKIEMEFE